MDLDKKNIGTACWKILTEDWLPTISTLVSPQHMNDITRIVVSNIHSNDQKLGEISVHGINMVLLRSAEFYELVNLRECTFKVLFDAFTSNISLLAKGSKHSEILSGLAEALQESSPRIQPLVQKALPLFQGSSMKQANTASSNSVVLNLFVQLEKLHLFPMEYFNKYQRQHLLLTMVLTERLFSIDGSDVCERNKVALLCRSFAHKLVRYRGEVGFLVGDVAFLQWWIRSTAALYVDEDTNIVGHRLYQNVVTTTVLLEKLLLSKLIEDANAGNQNSIDAISSCKSELKSIFLEEKNNTSNSAPVQLDFITALVAVLNAQRIARAKRNREATQVILDLGDLRDLLYSYVISNCSELKQAIHNFMNDVNRTSKDTDSQRFMSTSKCVISFSPILALSHQLLRQHHANTNVKDDQISALLVPILSVISPCLKYLQMYISTQYSSEEKVLAKLLGVCGEMAITLCSAVPELQNNDVTQRAVAFVWYVYEIAHSHGEEECKNLVDKAFSGLIPTLSQDQFIEVLNCIMQKSGLEYHSEEQAVQDNVKTETVLHFLWLLMNNCSPDQRKPFREQISSVIIMISNVMEKALSPSVLKQSLRLFADIANDQSIGLRTYDISLVVAGITQLRSPNLPAALKQATTKQDANDIFEGIFKVLSGILKNRRQQLVQAITPFTAILETLVHCFRSLHPSVAIATRKRKQDNKKRMLQDQTFSLLTDHAPLNEMCARSYARLLDSLGDQSATNTANTTSGKSHNLAKAFSKHSPYILAEYLSVQADPISTISLPALKSALRPGLFSLLDICGEHERDMLMAAIDTSQKMLLKTLYADWSKTHRYTGR
ncbi:Urb2/Npa2 family-domain-containing protein [Umbelopsis sp. AD052]|nr:Urb2/Npa2 family-domain-containing protein [Umbelopsis sp. AD052]